MKRMLLLVGLISLVAVTISGCTSFGGMSNADKPGSYYIATNKALFPMGTRAGVLLCTSGAVPSKLDCKDVEIEYK